MTPEQIKEARAKAGLTGDQAARVVYVNPRTWWRWELGESAMPRAAWELFTLRTQAPTDMEPSDDCCSCCDRFWRC